jgi:NitT/TauT family transport system ATP-binding protein
MHAIPEPLTDGQARHQTTIACRNLGVTFDDGTTALRGVDLSIGAGEIVSLIGPSGCGKSTLLRVIAGLQPITSGEVRFEPRPLGPGSLGFVFQDAALVPWRSAIANVQLPLEVLSITSRDERRRLAERVLIDVGLKPEDHRKFPRQLSGGMRMRVSIARALASDPQILLMDEPFAALDDLLRGRLLELLQMLWLQHPRTMLFVTHNIGEALILSQRLVVLNAGGVTAELKLPWDYPRRSELRGTTEFGKFYTQVSQSLAQAGAALA